MGGLVKKRENKSIENVIDNESEDDVLLKVESVIKTSKKTKKTKKLLKFSFNFRDLSIKVHITLSQPSSATSPSSSVSSPSSSVSS